MLSFIAVVLPSVIGVKLIDYLNKGISFKNCIYYFCGLLVTSSIVNMVLSYCLFNIKSNVLLNLNNLPIYFSKFCLVSLIVNLLLSLLFVVIIKNLKFNVVVLNEKN